MSIFTNLLYPLEWVIALIWVGFLKLFTMMGMSDTSGWTWALAIGGVTCVVRACLIPLFVKQIKSSRRMQLIQPEIAKIQKKYKGRTDQASREAMTREQMDLYKKTGTNPFSSCMPLLIQMPIFFALIGVLGRLGGFADGSRKLSMFGIEPLSQELAQRANASTLWGVKLSDTMMPMTEKPVNVLVLCAVLILFMAFTQFVSSWQMFRQNMPQSALEGPMAQTNKIMMYAMPIIFAVTGVNFPLGTLIYWLFSNLWSVTQQYIIMRNMPTPGSPAYERMKARKEAKGKAHQELTLDHLMGGSPAVDPAEGAEPGVAEKPKPVTTQRPQPVGKKRSKKKR